MKLKQPPDLNCLLVCPCSRAERRQTFLSFAPALLLASVVLVESAVVRSLQEELPGPLFVNIVVAVSAPFLVGIWIVFPPVNLYKFVNRTIEFRDKWLILQPHPKRFIPWNCVIAFQLEPVPGRPALTLLNVISIPSASRKLQNKWRIILDKATQIPLLLAELKVRQNIKTPVLVQEFDEPLARRSSRPVRGLTPFVWGTFLLSHGLKILIVIAALSVDAGGQDEKPLAHRTPFSRLVQKHFTSFNDFRRFILVSGSVLTGVGALCLARGISGRETSAEFDHAGSTMDGIDAPHAISSHGIGTPSSYAPVNSILFG
jgi:hypothetical protein